MRRLVLAGWPHQTSTKNPRISTLQWIFHLPNFPQASQAGSLAEVAILNACVQQAKARSAVEWAGGGPPSPTYSRALVSPLFKSEIAPTTAPLSKSEMTLEAAKLGLASSTSAAPPETCGHAIDVPLKDVLPVSDRCDADTTSLPGAQMSVQLP